jgi:hypothetical protein
VGADGCAYILYNGLGAPGGLMASAKLRLGLKTLETIHNQRFYVFTIEP